MNSGSTIYLASRSPRRRELLKQIGVKFDPLLLRLASARGGPDVDEGQHSGETPADYVERTAREKAAFGLKALSMRSMVYRPVLAADTIVIVGRRNTGETGQRRRGRRVHAPALPAAATKCVTAIALAIQGPRAFGGVRVHGQVPRARTMSRSSATARHPSPTTRPAATASRASPRFSSSASKAAIPA